MYLNSDVSLFQYKNKLYIFCCSLLFSKSMFSVFLVKVFNIFVFEADDYGFDLLILSVYVLTHDTKILNNNCFMLRMRTQL